MPTETPRANGAPGQGCGAGQEFPLSHRKATAHWSLVISGIYLIDLHSRQINPRCLLPRLVALARGDRMEIEQAQEKNLHILPLPSLPKDILNSPRSL